MKMDIVAGSANDEFYTPGYAIEPLFLFIATHEPVWCPFDTEDSLFVKLFRARGNPVIASHLAARQDFFVHEPREPFRYIISNPPYSLKTEVFERLFKMNKDFAMLVGVVGLFESKRRYTLFRDNPFEIMYFNKRISYFKNFDDQKPSLNPPFSSVYIARGLFPNRIMFAEVNK